MLTSPTLQHEREKNKKTKSTNKSAAEATKILVSVFFRLWVSPELFRRTRGEAGVSFLLIKDPGHTPRRQCFVLFPPSNFFWKLCKFWDSWSLCNICEFYNHGLHWIFRWIRLNRDNMFICYGERGVIWAVQSMWTKFTFVSCNVDDLKMSTSRKANIFLLHFVVVA